ncbi:MAG: ATP-binding protein [Candidatus Marinimicrobia bacterium]|nr:ATP-binding protein [Candidatus Neomarinimicrobiota bacterium]
MVKRQLTQQIKEIAKKMPVVAVLGPRQSGKTTLVKVAFPNYNYVNFEDLEIREFAKDDPKAFLENYNSPVIFDEIQYVPNLFSYIQLEVDNKPKETSYILTDSQNILLLESINQSLAGRIALFNLLPFSLTELTGTIYDCDKIDSFLFNGFYPRIYDNNLDPSQWLSSYVKTYVEKDVRQMVSIGDLSSFIMFLKVCAGRVGHLVNFSAIANEIGVSYQTVKRWISILEASYIIYKLPPFYKNVNKRVVKTNKLYFYDVGLVTYLLGIRNEDQLLSHYARGELFENMIVMEIVKNIYNKGLEIPLHFWRDRSGNEVDLLVEAGDRPIAIEIKSSKTIRSSFDKGLQYLQKIKVTDSNCSFVIYGGDKNERRTLSQFIGWKNSGKISMIEIREQV